MLFKPRNEDFPKGDLPSFDFILTSQFFFISNFAIYISPK